MRKDNGLNGGLDRPPSLAVASDVTPFQGWGELFTDVNLGLRWRYTPGYHMAGFQPSHVAFQTDDLDGPKACPRIHIIGFPSASLSGPKARNVKAWAVVSPTNGGPGQPSPQIYQAL